jgi:hypothetical protein
MIGTGGGETDFDGKDIDQNFNLIDLVNLF